MISRFRRLQAHSVLASALILGLGVAHADRVDDIGKKLVQHKADAQRLNQGIRSPSQIKASRSKNLASRRLIDAQVQFGIGNYDDAAILLYDFVAKYPNNRDYDQALYYLGESLFQKGDNVAARGYFGKLIGDIGPTSKFYQQSLERLIELSLRLNDPTGVDEWLAAVDKLPASTRRPSIPYVRGKYAHFSGKYDDAIRFFSAVPAKSKYTIRARFFQATSHIAKGELAPAVTLLEKITKTPTKGKDDGRVAELTQMALGRLHYEQGQLSKAIDRYLRISRKSDLFDEVLYEVAWVYVKNKEYPKALRALELLALTDPHSSRMPEVRILEGNLRIRKAQTLGIDGTVNATEEYDKALKVFEQTKAAFEKPHDELAKLMAEQADLRQFMGYITGRQYKSFEIQASLPEVAAAWLREEPEVKRVVAVETDLEQIQGEIAEARKTVARLERAINSKSRVDIFPELSDRRHRATEIAESVDGLRQELVGQFKKRVKKSLSASDKSSLAAFANQRKKIRAEIGEIPDSSQKYGERVRRARNRFQKVGENAAEVQLVLDSARAEILALEKFIAESPKPPKDLPELKQRLVAERETIAATELELEALRRDITLGQDTAGTGDQDALRERGLREQLRVVLDREARFLGGLVGRLSGKDATKARQILSQLTLSNSILLETERVNAKIDQVVDDALAEVRTAIEDERTKLEAYNREYENYQTESIDLGGEVLGSAFGEVANKFQDVLMRSDVGVVDVAWSHKETTEALYKRLILDQARERKTLDSDFVDVIREKRREEEKAAQEEAEKAAKDAAESGEGDAQ
jgi:tetratricopeptide (TPR) repeat protein